MKHLLPLSMLLISLISRSALADEIYDKCMENSDGKNSSWDACGYEWEERADEMLNEAWQALYQTTSGQTKIDLLAEQRAWNDYKEESCNFLRNGEWGREGTVLHYHICRAKAIESRAEELQRYEAQLREQ